MRNVAGKAGEPRHAFVRHRGVDRAKRRPSDAVAPGPDQESVWDYPRPPRLEPVAGHIVVVLAGEVVADTHRALRVLETSHPPTYYIPPQDVRAGCLVASSERTFCEFKGVASYWSLHVGDRLSALAAWSYAKPSDTYQALKDHISFYPSRVDACYVDGEQVQAQSGDFYGGWITSRVVGPFKGGPGTQGW